MDINDQERVVSPTSNKGKTFLKRKTNFMNIFGNEILSKSFETRNFGRNPLVEYLKPINLTFEKVNKVYNSKDRNKLSGLNKHEPDDDLVKIYQKGPNLFSRHFSFK